MCRILRRCTLSIAILLSLCGVLALWAALQQQDPALAISPLARDGSMPDGFAIWHHLDMHGIRVKSITPQNNSLLIKFDTNAQSAAAKEVLDCTLPHDYIIAQQEESSPTSALISRLLDTSHRPG